MAREETMFGSPDFEVRARIMEFLHGRASDADDLLADLLECTWDEPGSSADELVSSATLVLSEYQAGDLSERELRDVLHDLVERVKVPHGGRRNELINTDTDEQIERHASFTSSSEARRQESEVPA